MNWWVLLVVALAAASALGGAAWTDRQNRRRRQALLDGPPERAIPGLADAPAPTYIRPTDDAPGRPLTEERRHELQQAVRQATVIEGGWARDRFVTDPPTRWAVLDRPTVLVTPKVTAFRELWPALAAAQQDADQPALVVVALAFDPATVDTLLMNATAGTLPCVAVRCPTEAALGVAAMATGGQVVDEASLQSGFLPRGALGMCGTWVAAGGQSWAL